MTVNLKLLTSEKLFPEGYPLTFIVQHQGVKRKFKIGHSFPEHFLDSEGLITSEHPDYDELLPVIMDYKLKARKILAKNPTNVNVVYKELFEKSYSAGTFKDFTESLIKEMSSSADKFELQKDFTSANKIRGNVKVYQGALNQLEQYRPDVMLTDIDYDLLNGFKEWKLLKGNSKSTVSLYLRSLSSIYNKAVKIFGLNNEVKPFDGVYTGLSVKSSQTRKKYVSHNMVKQLEGFKHDYESMYRWSDLWLLQFYFGGADLIDVYYLKNEQIKNGRVYLQRSKGNGGALIDIAVHPKAQAILEKHGAASGEYVFPWRKDTEGYKTFRRNLKRNLEKIQKRAGIELEGLGGKLGVKMVRHTFRNIAKSKGIEEDIIREIMGHEKNEVVNYYQDRFTEKMRDEALFKIIG